MSALALPGRVLLLCSDGALMPMEQGHELKSGMEDSKLGGMEATRCVSRRGAERGW